MQNIKLEIEYDGTNFSGWEIQPNKRTVRGEIERKLCEVLQEKVNLTVASRTDAGVHAICQVANFKTNSKLPISTIKRALLGLPRDIYVKRVTLMPLEFDTRIDATSRVYLYIMLLGRSALLRTRVWEYKYELDISRMERALSMFVGVHRFDLFSCRERGECEVKSFTLTQNSNKIIFEIEANRFLHKMVRMIIGALTEVGRGKIDVEAIKLALDISDSTFNNKLCPKVCAPGCGLYLKEVKY